MNNLDYPIFCGKVLSVTGVIEMSGNVYTSLQYLEGLDDVTNKDFMAHFLPNIVKYQEGEVPLEERVKTAIIPMRLDPELISKSSIRTRFSTLEGEDGNHKTYEIEIIKPGYDSKIDSGFKYIKVLDE